MFSSLPLSWLLLPLSAVAIMADNPETTQTASATPTATGVAAQLPEVIQQALAFDASQWADGPVQDNPFYQAPSECLGAAPGTLLRVESQSNTSLWALPPSTSLSRIVYQTKTLGGKPVPASAFVLWPYSARKLEDGKNQVVVWTHGTSGITANSAPSHYTNLWHNYLGPYALAMQGYTVVGPDYAGMGVAQTADGKPLVHEYCAAPAQANDAVYAFQAARSAFLELGHKFVVIGHSEGGGAAWGVAQRQVKEPVPGYLGAVAISPVTNFVKNPEPVRSYIGAAMITSIIDFFPNSSVANVLTPAGKQRVDTVNAVGGNTQTLLAIYSGAELFESNWTSDPDIVKYSELVSNGGRPFTGPLLVLQGTGDQLVNDKVTVAAVAETKKYFPQGDISLVLFPGLDHNPTIVGSQNVWMEWIDDRFCGRPTRESRLPAEETIARQANATSKEVNWYLSVASEFFQTP